MIGTSRFDYWFIRLCIFGLHFLAPLCLLYCIFVVVVYGSRATLFRFPLFIETLAVAETLFYLFVYTPYRIHLQKEAVHPACPSFQARQELFALCNASIPDAEAYLQKWFLGAPVEEIKRENVKEFMLWAFFNRSGPPGNDDEELEGYVDATEKLLGRRIVAGWGKAKCLRLTLDRVDLLHRSLTWYFVSHLL